MLLPANSSVFVFVKNQVFGDDTLVHPDVGEPRTWRNSDYFDLCLSAFGFYVAMLGIKATTENTRRLSRRYLICTIIVGCLWNGFYYYLNVQAEKDLDAKRIAKHTEIGRAHV